MCARFQEQQYAIRRSWASTSVRTGTSCYYYAYHAIFVLEVVVLVLFGRSLGRSTAGMCQEAGAWSSRVNITISVDVFCSGNTNCSWAFAARTRAISSMNKGALAAFLSHKCHMHLYHNYINNSLLLLELVLPQVSSLSCFHARPRRLLPPPAACVHQHWPRISCWQRGLSR